MKTYDRIFDELRDQVNRDSARRARKNIEEMMMVNPPAATIHDHDLFVKILTRYVMLEVIGVIDRLDKGENKDKIRAEYEEDYKPHVRA